MVLKNRSMAEPIKIHLPRGGVVHGDWVGYFVERNALNHACEPQAVIAVKVRHQQVVDAVGPHPVAEHLPLSALARIEQQPAIAPSQVVAVVVTITGRYLARCSEHHEFALHGALVAHPQAVFHSWSFGLLQHTTVCTGECTMSVINQLIHVVSQQLTHPTVAKGYAALSVEPEQERARLRALHQPFFDPLLSTSPTGALVRRTGDRVVRQATTQITVLSSVATVAGAISVIPEWLASAALMLRLAQRLAIIYHVDLDTDAGQQVFWRSLAAGLQVPLPKGGSLAQWLTNARGKLAKPTGKVVVTQALLRFALRKAKRPLGRLIPAIAIVFTVRNQRHQARAMGDRMHAVFYKHSPSLRPAIGTVQDAVEV